MNRRLKEDVGEWLPTEIGTVERQNLLDGLVNETLNTVNEAIGYDSSAQAGNGDSTEEGDVEGREAPEEEGEEAPGRDPNL